jgi:tRNA nucleotidyltransferase/poly(A) polymerase
MRALRFASVLGFAVEENTSDAIFRNMRLLQNIAVERIACEFNQFIAGKGASELLDMYTPVLLEIMPEINPGKKYVTRWLNKIGENMLRRLLELKNDGAALAVLDEIVRQQHFSLKDLAVNGNDLLAAGVPPGVQVGAVLNRLMELAADGQVPNDREALLDAARGFVSF